MSLSIRASGRTAALLAAAAFSFTVAGPATEADGRLVAPGSECRGQQNVKAPEPRQEDAMRCLINFARDRAGAGELGAHRALERAAGRKAGDVKRCGLSHTACGHPADLYADRFGYTSGSFQWGENLAWERGKHGSARSILKAWLSSPPHRETMLRGSFDDLGLGLRRGGFAGHDNAAVWVLELGCRACT
jgi:uncharacterized protein YkwD